MLTGLLALLIACVGGDPKSLLACDDIECKKRVAISQWKDEQDALVRDLIYVKDPIEQVALVEALTEAYPGETAALCALLPEGAGRERCDRINIRPHLASSASTTGQVNTTSQSSSSSPSAVDLTSSNVKQGPGMTLLLPSSADAFATSPWDGMAVRPVTCEDEPSERACRAAAAQGYAREAKAEWAAGACAGIDAGQWRWECMFNAAEAAAAVHGPKAARAAYELCMGAGDYLANCFAHAAMGVAETAPAANAASAEDWKPLMESIEASRDVLKVRDPDLAERVVERIWSEATHYAYRRVSELSGDPLDHLPADVHPHVRAAAAWQLVSQESSETRTLEAWGKRLDEVLKKRLKGGGSPPSAGTRGPPVKNLWAQLYTGEEIFKQVLFLGQARRVQATKAEDDALVCLLEAIARAPNRPVSIFQEALKHPTQEVRWTAARLIQALDTSGQYTSQLLQEQDALVRGRGVSLFGMGPGGMAPQGMAPAQNQP